METHSQYLDASTTAPQHTTYKQIGRLAEGCFKWYFQNTRRYSLLDHQVVIRDEDSTLGELDFILLDTELHKHLHVELACKFYLYDPKLGSGINGWIGPNRNDLLKQKLDRLREHQFPLLHREETKMVLSELELSTTETQQRLILKGFLFTPVEAKNWNDQAINTAAHRGTYAHLEYWKMKLAPETLVAIIPKPTWICRPHDNVSWMPFSECVEALETAIQARRSTMIWINYSTRIDSAFVTWW